MKKPFSFTIRKKLLLLSIAVLSLPYVGYQYVREMEHYLREGLEMSLTGTASNVSGLLSGRDDLFPQIGQPDAGRSEPLFIHPMKQVVQLDGYPEEWQAWLDWADNMSSVEGSLNTKIILAARGNYLYILLISQDDQLIYQRPEKPFSNQSDQVELFVENNKGERQHYWIAPSAPGQISAYQQGKIWNEDIWEEQPVVRAASNISGVWQQSKSGYTLELKVPLRMVGQSLGFIVTDVDDVTSREMTGQVSTFNGDNLNQLASASSKVSEAIQKLDIADGRRVWVLDTAGHVLTSQGDLKSQYRSQFLNRIYAIILPSASSQFKDDLAGASRLRGSDVNAALSGETGIRWRSSPDNKAAIVTAAQPIHSGEDIIGVVVAEETTGNIQTVQRKAMADLFTRSLLVFIGVTSLLLIFASSISNRIRRLAREADQAIDTHGRVLNTNIGKPWRDELGDLSLHYSQMLERLKQYNEYLESLASKLSHELRTPMAVVQSSLDSLDVADNPEDAKLYVDRARVGIKQLQTLLSRLSESTRLEAALQSSEKEPVLLDQILSGCIAGYRAAYPDQHFDYQFEVNHQMLINCSPELIVQMLDKLISNAVGFSQPDCAVTIKVTRQDRQVNIAVINLGPLLPEKYAEQLFASMISIRDSKDPNEPHLGLGLYIARIITEFHNGDLSAKNLQAGDGVVFTVKLPVYG